MTPRLPIDLSAATIDLGRALRRLFRTEKGATAITFGAMATVLVGFAGVAVEGGSWYVTRRAAQTAADTAAQAGAAAVAFNRPALAAAVETGARNGFTDGANNTTVTVNSPPAQGPNAGDASAVEVIVQRAVPLQIAALFMGGNATIATRAVARSVLMGGGSACILALGEQGGNLVQEVDLSMGGNASVTAASCSLASNTSIKQFGNSKINAFTLAAVGTVQIGNPNNVTLERPPASFQPPIQDPFAPDVPGTGVPLPAQSGTCNHTNYSLNPNQTQTLSPGRYCGGMDLKGTANLTPGVYVLQNGDMTANAQANISCPTCTPGNGVTFVFTGEVNQIGGPKINGGATINLAGGTSQYPGMLMYQDPRAPAANDIKLNGGANITTSGLFYFPSADLTINGNFGGSNTTCKAFIGESIVLTGTTEQVVRVDGCAALGLDAETDLPQIRIVRLVE
ncbi:pilus assembly protein TadG-related protein [Elioraea sp.]|uniref:pilus assembly protein TadG-related protein n=1 Tax=Elioraea sp. TaxID=2185103 RepID=UPI003F720F5A